MERWQIEINKKKLAKEKTFSYDQNGVSSGEKIGAKKKPQLKIDVVDEYLEDYENMNAPL